MSGENAGNTVPLVFLYTMVWTDRQGIGQAIVQAADCGSSRKVKGWKQRETRMLRLHC